MKATKFFAAVFAVLAICTALLTVYLGFSCRDAVPVMLEKNYLAQSQAVALMNALCKGDFDGVSQRMLGQPQLGADREPAADVGGLLWEAYTASLSYELEGDCYTTDNGVAQKVKLTCLDLDSATAQLNERTIQLLAQRVEEARDLDEIYDENDQYRQEFLMAAVYDAAEELLETAGKKTVELTLNLCYQDGQWWVVADNTLLDVLSGSTQN